MMLVDQHRATVLKLYSLRIPLKNHLELHKAFVRLVYLLRFYLKYVL